MDNLEIGSYLQYVGMHFQDENTCGFFPYMPKRDM